MRKQTKIAAVVSAAALLALGASITSFAGAKGTWILHEGEWYCYDKNGDVYENTFCNSNGKEYYVGEDGIIVRSDWVEYDGSYYFVNSSGAKITNDWRLTTPYDDEDAEEEWYYFQSTGKRAENKKIVYKGQTFFFDAEGRMLTGWVTADGVDVVNEEATIDKDHTYFCDETGARITANWVYTTEPTAEDDEADAEEYYYYLQSSGKPVVNKKMNNIKGQSYIFNEEGQMLSGWVAKVDAASSSNAYVEIDGETDAIALNDDDILEAYYCGDEDDGHVKKNTWRKLWRPTNMFDADEDVSKKWYWFEKDGKVFLPDAEDTVADAMSYKFEEGQLNEDTASKIVSKKVNSKDYFFNTAGEMVSGFQTINFASDSNANGMYYFGGGDDGSMKTGSQSIKDDNGDVYKFYFGTRTATKAIQETKGVGITGNKGNKLYSDGMLIKAEDWKYQVATVTIDGEEFSFIINQNGSIQHGNTQYKEDGEVLIDTKTTYVKDAAGKDTDDKEYYVAFRDNAEDYAQLKGGEACKYSIKTYPNNDKDEEVSIGNLKNTVEEIVVERK